MSESPVVLTRDEYTVLKNLASSANMSVGAFVRRLIAREAYERGLILPAVQQAQSTGEGGSDGGEQAD